MAVRLAKHVRATLGVLGLEWGQLQVASQRDMYVVLICQALKAAWLAATTEAKPLGWFEASLHHATEAGRQEGADEMLDKVQRRLVEATQGKNAVDTSTRGKEKANNGE